VEEVDNTVEVGGGESIGEVTVVIVVGMISGGGDVEEVDNTVEEVDNRESLPLCTDLIFEGIAGGNIILSRGR
jgi:hypothetical protein